MTDRFSACVEFTLREEGPPGTEAGDPGGYTKYGRDQASWSETLDRLPRAVAVNLPSHVRDLSEGQAMLSYRWFEWQLMSCDNLPVGLDLVAFDCAVNPGPGWAPDRLQWLVGVTVDGQIGPITLAAVRRRPVATLINDFSAARKIRYENDSEFHLFGDGWLGRTERCRVAALGMVGA